MNLWAWQFNAAKTQGLGRRVADIEAGVEEPSEKREGEMTEHVSLHTSRSTR
jgi:hypothetical protein